MYLVLCQILRGLIKIGNKCFFASEEFMVLLHWNEETYINWLIGDQSEREVYSFIGLFNVYLLSIS